MKKLTIIATVLVIGSLIFTGCKKDFLDVNIDPKAASIDQVQVEYLINNSITQAQMDPHISERVFVLYWKIASRQYRGNGSLAWADYDDGWSSDYYSYLSGWLKDATLAVNVADDKIAKGVNAEYNKNLKQVARIWRAYLMSEFADNFGPMPIDGFQGKNPEFKDVKTVYYFILDELKDAVAQMDLNITAPDEMKKFDRVYGFDFNKWIKYANSIRMRLAMRLSEVDPSKAQSEFEAAESTGDFIATWNDAFKAKEQPGWDALTGVMSREWNTQALSATLNNIYIGLGGIPSQDQLPANLHEYIKPADYMGIRYENHLPTFTNDPSTGFWFDGLPYAIDPRAYKAFIIPGWFDNPDFCYYPSWTQDAFNTQRDLFDDNGNVLTSINAAFTWNAAALGNWGSKSGKNKVSTYLGANPRMTMKFRRSDSERVFFGPWETYFLIAEAAVRGWSAPMNAQTAYEEGIKASFEYWGLTDYLQQYLESESYNRVGTSVKWSHTTPPPQSVAMNYVNGYTSEVGVWNMEYPKNDLYSGTSNDHLVKIITQKYLAQFPWLPLEAWNDHRRLGLPFFENPSVENPITTLPDLNQANCKTSSVKFFPQRLKYPSSLSNSNPDGYNQAVKMLGGPDEILTPLWWAKKNP